MIEFVFDLLADITGATTGALFTLWIWVLGIGIFVALVKMNKKGPRSTTPLLLTVLGVFSFWASLVLHWSENYQRCETKQHVVSEFDHQFTIELTQCDVKNIQTGEWETHKPFIRR